METVFTAAFRLLIAEGARSITANRIHRETGIARTTIHRHWLEPADLLAAMPERATGDQDTADFTGDLRIDLEIAVESLVFRFNHRPVRPLFGALVEHGRHEPGEADIAASYVEGILRPVRRAVAEGIERGDLESGDMDEFVPELSGPLLVRHVLLGHEVHDADAKRVLDVFLDRHEAR